MKLDLKGLFDILRLDNASRDSYFKSVWPDRFIPEGDRPTYSSPGLEDKVRDNVSRLAHLYFSLKSGPGNVLDLEALGVGKRIHFRKHFHDAWQMKNPAKCFSRLGELYREIESYVALEIGLMLDGGKPDFNKTDEYVSAGYKYLKALE